MDLQTYISHDPDHEKPSQLYVSMLTIDWECKVNWGKILIFSSLLTSSFFDAAWAQDSLRDLTIAYAQDYQLQKSFTFLYDNQNELTKINEFKFEFFNEANVKVGQTEIGSHPLESQVSVHKLDNPIVGFNSSKLSIISLHSGDVSNLSSAASILALNEDNEVEEDNEAVSPPPPPPILDIPAHLQDAESQLITELNVLTSAQDSLAERLMALLLDPTALDQSELVRLSGLIDKIAQEKATNSGFKPDRLVEFENQAYALNADVAEEINRRQAAYEELSSNISSFENDRLAFETDVADWKVRQNQPTSDPDYFNGINSELTAVQARQSVLETRASELNQSIENVSGLLSPPLFTPSQSTELSTLQNATNMPPKGVNWVWVLGALVFLGGAVSIVYRNQSKKRKKMNEARKSQIEDLTSKIKIADIESLNAISNVPWDKFSPGKPILTSDFQHSLRNLNHDEINRLRVDLERELKTPLNPQTIEDILGRQTLPTLPPHWTPNPQLPPRQIPGQHPDVPTQPNMGFGGRHAYVFLGGATLTYQASSTVVNSLFDTSLYSEEDKIIGAVGRVGAPFGYYGEHEEYHNLGTGVLISKKHILTNYHIFDNSGGLLVENDEDGRDDILWGIEFLGLEGLATSDFHVFDGSSPIWLPGLDLAIFTLAEEITTREPVELKPIDISTYDGRAAKMVGYPDPKEHADETDILDFYGEDAVYGVKRLTYGNIVRPADAEPDQYDFMFPSVRFECEIPVFCHRISAVSANSGSPIIDTDDNSLLGIHFRGGHEFLNAEVNLAMPINPIIDAIRELDPTILEESSNDIS